MRVRVYIAGPMTGYKNFNREAFHNAEEELKREGHTVLNPAVLPDGLTLRCTGNSGHYHLFFF